MSVQEDSTVHTSFVFNLAYVVFLLQRRRLRPKKSTRQLPLLTAKSPTTALPLYSALDLRAYFLTKSTVSRIIYWKSSTIPTVPMRNGRYVAKVLQTVCATTTTRLTNIFLQTCKVMSGFRKDEPYFVPRTKVPLPHTIDWYCVRLLPKLNVWRQQAQSREGDKSSCAYKFLYRLLPYFVQVLVQDGIYFIRDFPSHPMSNYLKVSFLLTSK